MPGASLSTRRITVLRTKESFYKLPEAQPVGEQKCHCDPVKADVRSDEQDDMHCNPTEVQWYFVEAQKGCRSP